MSWRRGRDGAPHVSSRKLQEDPSLTGRADRGEREGSSIKIGYFQQQEKKNDT